MTEQTVWQPVEDGEYPSPTLTKRVIVIGGLLGIVGKSGGFCIALPDSLRLCRRVPAPQGVSVPYPIRSVLDAALIVYITECRQVDDPDGEALARQAQQWLDGHVEEE